MASGAQSANDYSGLNWLLHCLHEYFKICLRAHCVLLSACVELQDSPLGFQGNIRRNLTESEWLFMF